jgi:hypothetical protein
MEFNFVYAMTETIVRVKHWRTAIGQLTKAQRF